MIINQFYSSISESASSTLVGYEGAIESSLGTMSGLTPSDLSLEPVESPDNLTAPIFLLFLIQTQSSKACQSLIHLHRGHHNLFLLRVRRGWFLRVSDLLSYVYHPPLHLLCARLQD